MRCLVLGAISVVLSGCAVVGPAQEECSRSPSFLDMNRCLHARLDRETRTGIGFYLAKADELADEVRAGRKTDARAKQELYEVFARLDQDYRARSAETARAVADGVDNYYKNRYPPLPPPAPETTTNTNCYRYRDGSLSCTSTTR